MEKAGVRWHGENESFSLTLTLSQWEREWGRSPTPALSQRERVNAANATNKNTPQRRLHDDVARGDSGLGPVVLG